VSQDDDPSAAGMRHAGTGGGSYQERQAAGRIFAAELIAGRSETDSAIRRANNSTIDRVHVLASCAGAPPAAIGVKLAVSVRPKAADVAYDLSPARSADQVLLASALADLVILGDTPMDLRLTRRQEAPGPAAALGVMADAPARTVSILSERGAGAAAEMTAVCGLEHRAPSESPHPCRDSDDDCACMPAFSVQRSESMWPRRRPRRRDLTPGRPHRPPMREDGGREAALTSQSGAEKAPVNPDLSSAKHSAPWMPWSHILKFAPSLRCRPFFRARLQKFEPAKHPELWQVRLNGRGYSIRKNVSHKMWSAVASELIKLLEAGQIEAQGRQADVGAPISRLGPHVWRYADLISGCAISQSKATIAGTTWFDLQVHKACTNSDVTAGASAITNTLGLPSAKQVSPPPTMPKMRTPQHTETVDFDILKKMHERIISGKASGPSNAASEYVCEIKGKGTADSRLRRVVRKYKALPAVRLDQWSKELTECGKTTEDHS